MSSEDKIQPQQARGMLDAVALQTLVWEQGERGPIVQQELMALTFDLAMEDGEEEIQARLIQMLVGSHGMITWLLLQLRQGVGIEPGDLLRFFAGQVSSLDA